MLYSVALHVDLERKQQREKELVLLVQASGCIFVHVIGHIFNNIANPFACNWTLCRPV